MRKVHFVLGSLQTAGRHFYACTTFGKVVRQDNVKKKKKMITYIAVREN